MNKAEHRRGEVFYEVIIKTLIVITTLLTVIGIYNVYVKYNSVNYICRRIVRAIEIEGAANNSVTTNLLSQLNTQTGCSAVMRISDVNYYDYQSKKIQLRDKFTVTVTDTYYIEIMNPMFAPPLRIPVTLTATLTGMSEVYHKR